MTLAIVQHPDSSPIGTVIHISNNTTIPLIVQTSVIKTGIVTMMVTDNKIWSFLSTSTICEVVPTIEVISLGFTNTVAYLVCKSPRRTRLGYPFILSTVIIVIAAVLFIADLLSNPIAYPIFSAANVACVTVVAIVMACLDLTSRVADTVS
jgi:hypothetical protein